MSIDALDQVNTAIRTLVGARKRAGESTNVWGVVELRNDQRFVRYVAGTKPTPTPWRDYVVFDIPSNFGHTQAERQAVLDHPAIWDILDDPIPKDEAAYDLAAEVITQIIQFALFPLPEEGGS